MEATEKIRQIGNWFIRITKEHPEWTFVTFKDFENSTGLEKAEIMQICELLKKHNLVEFEYMPFDDSSSRFDMFDKEQNIQDVTGAISFLPLSKIKAKRKKIKPHKIEVKSLQALISSDTELTALARELRPDITYDSTHMVLTSGSKSKELNSLNSKILAEMIFSKPFGTVFLIDDILPLLEGTTEKGVSVVAEDASPKFFSNIVTRLNQKLEEITGIHNLIQVKQERVWIE
jgi:hypothetical protein